MSQGRAGPVPKAGPAADLGERAAAATMTIVQRATTDGTRGRVAGALNAVLQAATIGSMAAAGILADVIGIRSVLVGGAVVAGAAAVVAWLLFRGAYADAIRDTAPVGAGAVSA